MEREESKGNERAESKIVCNTRVQYSTRYQGVGPLFPLLQFVKSICYSVTPAIGAKPPFVSVHFHSRCHTLTPH